ncbi:MAG TPA: sigma-70 family RNA polymerase sigma factor [Actinomycetota bacterium]
MWTLSDEALLAGLGSGDPDASAAFVRRYQARVYGLTLSVLRDPTAAEDAAQETFVRAWRHADAFDPRRGNVVAWLLTIARNVSINMLPGRRPDPVDPEVLVTMFAESRSDGDDGQATPVSEALREALRELPEDQRRALVLSVFYGFSAREVSELDEVPLGTVKTRVRSALTKLRAQLGGVR